MWSLFRLLDDGCRVEVLDVGASLASTAPYQKLVETGRARVTGFEPNEAEYERLRSSYGLTHRFYPLFVGDGKEATFHETNNPFTGSLYAPNTPLLEKFHALASLVTPVAEHRVATTCLDDIADLGDIDFIKIDVQGAELDVLRNGQRTLQGVLAIQTEVNFLEQYHGQAMFSDLDAFLRANGFQFHCVLGYGWRPFLPLLNPRAGVKAFNQQVWADAVYVRDWMQLDRLSAEKLEKYAGIMHDLLNSFDLAHVALVEADRRTGRSLAQEYRRRLVRDGLAIVDQPSSGDAAGSLAGKDSKAGSGTSSPISATVPAENPDNSLVLETESGLCVSVPASLTCISTYVLLEQERWFEKEVDFVVRYLADGMTAIDIGANVGLYSLAMAKAVGPTGRVCAYEPGTVNRQHLERSIELNKVANIELSAAALSDREKSGWLRIAGSGELNSIVEADEDGAEYVEISSLDVQTRRFGWTGMDFIKIDAEGQEARIVAGGREFFHSFSPVVMYEIKHGATHNNALRWTFEALGYETYRLIGDGSLLVRLGDDEQLDTFELNLFAIKPDRARELARRGLLVFAPAEISLSPAERDAVLKKMFDLPYAQTFGISADDIDACPFGEGLTAYATWLFLDPAIPERRYAALRKAFQLLRDYSNAQLNPAALSTLGRIAQDIGYRGVAVAALGELMAMRDTGIDQPFFPAARRFEQMRPDGHEDRWFIAAASEQIELVGAYSSMLKGDDLHSQVTQIARLRLLCGEPWSSVAMLRRAILMGVEQGIPRRDIASWHAQLLAQQTRNLHVWGAYGNGMDPLFEG